jgi:hypothetical protein
MAVFQQVAIQCIELNGGSYACSASAGALVSIVNRFFYHHTPPGPYVSSFMTSSQPTPLDVLGQTFGYSNSAVRSRPSSCGGQRRRAVPDATGGGKSRCATRFRPSCDAGHGVIIVIAADRADATRSAR